MTSLKDLFDTILNGNKEESRIASKGVRKFIYGSHGEGKYKEIVSILNNAPQEYFKIKEDFRQENFVRAISVMYFLRDRFISPDFLFSWLFRLLINDNGNIRQSSRKMIESEIGSLTYHIRFPKEKKHFDLDPYKADQIIFDLFYNLHKLMNDFWKIEYKKYKYINSLPNCQYKTIQLILAELEDSCGTEYVEKLNEKYDNFVINANNSFSIMDQANAIVSLNYKPKINEGDFREVIGRALAESGEDARKIEYLNEVLRKYKEYQNFFNNVLINSKNDMNSVYTFKVNFIYDKPIWRDIEILGKHTFFDLAKKIIYSMNWQNDHMHGFAVPGEGERPDPLFTASALGIFSPNWEDDPHPTFKTNEIRICNIDYNKLLKFDFTFDYGDNHQFEVIFKNKREQNKKDKKCIFPKIVNSHGVPPVQYTKYI